MTEQLEPGSISPIAGSRASADVAEELLLVIQAVEGVTAVYPAQPLWQSIAGAAMAAVTGETLPLVGINGTAGTTDTLVVKARIGVEGSRPAPEVTREAARAIRKHLLPRAAVVEISVVKMGS